METLRDVKNTAFVGEGSFFDDLVRQATGKASAYANSKDLRQRLVGRFFTPQSIFQYVVRDVLLHLVQAPPRHLRIIDPFCGDGRLLVALAEAIRATPRLSRTTVYLEGWDCEADSVRMSEKNLREVSSLACSYQVRHCDTFEESLAHRGTFDLCITNPPWELLKPDPKELVGLADDERATFVELLKRKSAWLNERYPFAKATRSFSGWGVNLARCGIEASVQLTKEAGTFAIVAPGTIFADQVSERLRAWLFGANAVSDVRLFPAEAKLFTGVDQPAVTFVGRRRKPDDGFRMICHSSKEGEHSPGKEDWKTLNSLEDGHWALPTQVHSFFQELQEALSKHPTVDSFEKRLAFKLGRELDETRISERLTSAEGPVRFLKGKWLDRFQISWPKSRPEYLKATEKVPSSVSMLRIGWRDVARQSSSRRLKSTLIPAGIVTGNSVNVLIPARNSTLDVRALLGLWNSLVFEAQVRGQISTNHLSVGAIRRLRLPESLDSPLASQVAALVELQLNAYDPDRQAVIERLVFKWYGLADSLIEGLLDTMSEYDSDVKAWGTQKGPGSTSHAGGELVDNHIAPSLSDLDKLVCESVPPGGNWKDIPESVPSKRLQTIRDSFARGEGSRSTYYGRLDPNLPAYTVNTYFTRPGNGCHIHYDVQEGQHRTLSYREAARLQSFPDSFVFEGSKTSVATQIGNAVPPLLGYQIAKHLGITGEFVDLFAGAGGLAFGFEGAGWRSLVANEFDVSFAATHARNIAAPMVVGDITDRKVKAEVVRLATERRSKDRPLFVLGGPPCQGFSTAGKARSMDDERNWLFRDYCQLLARLKPAGFVFENVSGLLNMEGGRVFEMIKSELGKHARRLFVWKIQTERYGIPQRRTRVIIVGDNTGLLPSVPPPELTAIGGSSDLAGVLAPCPGARDALGDLAALKPGENGQEKGYRHAPQSLYQQLMRGRTTPEEYLTVLRNHAANVPSRT